MRGTVRVLAAVPRLFRAYHAPAPSLGLSATSARGGLGVFFLKLRPLFRALPRACPVPHPKRCSARRLTCLSAAAHRGPLRSPPRFRPRSSRGRRRASRRCRRLSLTPATLRRARLRRLRLPFSPLPLRGSGRLRYATPCRRASSPLRADSGLAVGLRPTRVPPRRPLLNARIRARVYDLRLCCYHDIRRLNR